jgi:hypothetical protein
MGQTLWLFFPIFRHYYALRIITGPESMTIACPEMVRMSWGRHK